MKYHNISDTLIIMKKIAIILSIALLAVFSCRPQAGQRWSEERVAKWYEDHGWVAG